MYSFLQAGPLLVHASENEWSHFSLFFFFLILFFIVLFVCFRYLKFLTLAVNIAYITWNYVEVQENQSETETLQVPRQIVGSVEMAGLFLYFIFIVSRLLANDWVGAVDGLRRMSTWSAFRLIYTFRPVAILTYLQSIYSNNVENQAKLRTVQMLSLRQSIKKEIDFIERRLQDDNTSYNVRDLLQRRYIKLKMWDTDLVYVLLF